MDIDLPMLPQSNTNSVSSAYQSLKWLFLLRNFLILGEALIILTAVYVVGYPVPEDRLWAVLSAIVIVNSLTWYRLQSTAYPVSDLELFFHLVFDVLGITAMLYLTGGATNPIAWFLLLPLIVTATVLPQIYTWYMVGLSSVCYTLLIGYHIPLPEFVPAVRTKELPRFVLAMQSEYDLDLHVFAMWFGFLLIAGMVAYFIVEMASSLRERNHRLAKAREQALRDERVVALGTLAASAAHEMGTPLGTMAILTHELEQDYSNKGFADLSAKMRILREQIDRCKKALSVMSASAGQVRAESGHSMPLEDYLDDLIHQWRSQWLDVRLKYVAKGLRPAPNIVADRTLTYALINILDNAADVSPTSIELNAQWDAKRLLLEVRDRGPGIRPEIAATAGKEPVTTKESGQGLGVGLFLACATIERLGGQVSLFNLESGGACTRITLPLLPSTASR